MESQQKLLSALRWIAFVPGAAIAAWLASIIVTVINRMTMSGTPVDPDDSFLGKSFITVVSSVAMGAAFVYTGSRIAPAKRKIIAYALTLIALLLAGFASYPAIEQRNWWALASLLFVAIGAGGVAYSVAERELDLDSHKLL